MQDPEPIQERIQGQSPKPEKMSRAEAGRKGGESTKAKYGPEYYQRIGRLGGAIGGRKTLERHGREHYQVIARLGGAAGRGRSTGRRGSQ